MDPDATLASLLDHLITGRREEAREDADNLHDWLRKRGASPSASSFSGLREIERRIITIALCEWVNIIDLGEEHARKTVS